MVRNFFKGFEKYVNFYRIDGILLIIEYNFISFYGSKEFLLMEILMMLV